MNSTTTQSVDQDYFFMDPPDPPTPPPARCQIANSYRPNSRKKRRTEVTARRTKPEASSSDVEDACVGEDDEIPHQWTSKQIRTLIQIRLSDEIDRRFRTTKKGHKHIWLAVAKKLQSLGIQVDHVQAQSKYNRLRREYTKRYTEVNKSGADRTPLYEWEFYADLEPSFRTCRQIQPDNVQCSEAPQPPSATPTTSSESTADDPGSSSTPSSAGALVFPNRRRKRPLTQDDRDQRTEERFQTMLQQMKEMDEQYKRFSDLF